MGDDPHRTKIAVAWTNTTVKRRQKLTKLTGKTESEIWDWLWENTEYSVEELLNKSALPSYGFEGWLNSLIGNRILYPDGTINSFAQRYLRDKVLKLFDAKPKRPATRKK